MDNQNVEGLLTGLASSLNSYLGTNIANAQKQQAETHKIGLELAKGKELEQYKSGLDLERGKELELNKQGLELTKQQGLELYKQHLQGTVDEKTAAAISPKHAEIVRGWAAAHNGELPPLEVADKLFDDIAKTNDSKIRRDEMSEARMNRFVNAHSNKLTQLKVPEVLTTYNELAAVFKTGKDVAGIGALDSFKPNVFLSEQGSANRTNLAQLCNILLNTRSGAAVSDHEYKRFLKETSGGKLQDEATVRKHLGKMGKDTRNLIAQQEAGIPTEALEIYKSHPGAITSDQVDLYDGNKPGVEASSAGKKSLDSIFGSK